MSKEKREARDAFLRKIFLIALPTDDGECLCIQVIGWGFSLLCSSGFASVPDRAAFVGLNGNKWAAPSGGIEENIHAGKKTFGRE